MIKFLVYEIPRKDKFIKQISGFWEPNEEELLMTN